MGPCCRHKKLGTSLWKAKDTRGRPSREYPRGTRINFAGNEQYKIIEQRTTSRHIKNHLVNRLCEMKQEHIEDHLAKLE